MAAADLGGPYAVAPKPAGFLEYTMRTTFRDLTRVYGFEGARELVAQIINDEADRRRQ